MNKMKWSKQAEKRLQRVPFFIRRFVKKKVEEYAAENGINFIEPEHLELLKERFMKNQEKELRGFSVETCLGAEGCPNRNLSQTVLPDKIENFLKDQGLKEFLTARLNRPIKIHNEFRVSISFCPNSCSRPQIVDVGLIGAVVPRVNLDKECTQCGACQKICKEQAITLDKAGPKIDLTKCLFCGDCIKACKPNVIELKKEGFRCQVGGKLGRRPRLGHELPEIFPPDETLNLIKKIVSFYKTNALKGQRLGALLDETGLKPLYAELNIPFTGEIK